MAVTAEDIRSLSVDERLDLIDRIWNSLAEHPNRVPVTDWQRQDLDRRLAEHQQNPSTGSSWEEVRSRLAR